MYTFIPKVEEILVQHNIEFTEQLDSDHITINTDEEMIDPGFAMDNKVLDLFIDDENQIVFIGLLRIPCQNRRKKIGSKIINQIIDWSEKYGYSLFLDSCGDSCSFWSKCGFCMVEHQYGFDIMGFGSDRRELKEKWKSGKRIFAETH